MTDDNVEFTAISTFSDITTAEGITHERVKLAEWMAGQEAADPDGMRWRVLAGELAQAITRRAVAIGVEAP